MATGELNGLKVLFHLDESGRWERVVTNVTNFLNDVGPGQAQVEVVANGEAVTVFATGSLDETGQPGSKPGLSLIGRMNELAHMGVRFTACRNALRSHSISETSLPGFVVVVPAGITEIAKKQSEGYAYIKP